MRIGLDIRYVYDHFPGIGRYSINLAQALARLDHPHTLILLHNPALPNTRYDIGALQALPNVELVSVTARPFSLAEQFHFPRQVNRLEFDVYHAPYYVKPYTGLTCPSIVTIHDLIGKRLPDVLSSRGRYLFDMMMWLAVRTAAHIITVSRSARDDILHYYRVAEERMTITPEAADQQFSPQPEEQVAQVRARYGLPQRYVLYLGSNKPHKNLVRLVQAWESIVRSEDTLAPPPHLVIAGHYDQRYPEAHNLVAEHQLDDVVSFVRDVAEADVPALYSGADVFVFPSYYEGFGLPPLEAMACGVPVVCAHASSLPEVVGNAALTFDPYDVGELAACLLRVLRDDALRGALRSKGFEQVARFSWERTARETLAVYEAMSQNRQAR